MTLPVGTRLFHGEYTVAQPLGRPSGFGNVYLGWQPALERKVVIKEYLPRDVAGRPSGLAVVSHSLDDEERWQEGLAQFRVEARTLARFEHPQIVAVHSFFEQNNTAYLVMKHYEGESLDQFLASRGKVPEREAIDILLPILEALQFLHERNILHRDVKPSNLYLRKGGLSLLLDFGTARPVPTEATQTTLRSPGYSALELHAGGLSGPWTDVYAAAATLYHLVTGQKPPEAPRRLEKDGLLPLERLEDHGISLPVSQALVAGLAVHGADRPKTVAAFQDMLTGPPREGWTPMIIIPEPMPQAGEVRHSGKEGIEYVWIPPGIFEMGAVQGDTEAARAEKPRHKVSLSNGFWLGRTTVTVAAYRKFVEEWRGKRLPRPPYFNTDWEKGDHPIVNVSWEDAQAYCAWADARLPTEEEWEFAARGGLAGKKYPWGDEAPIDQPGARNGARFRCEDGPLAGATYAANGYGLFDIAGNVWEWCQDHWHDTYETPPKGLRDWFLGYSMRRVLRGGSFLGDDLRVSARRWGNLASFSVYGDFGFRCARDIFP